MHEFKVGDRVRVYMKLPFVGKVTHVTSFGIFVVEDGFDACHNDAPYHPKAIRYLKPKKPRLEVYANTYSNGLPLFFRNRALAEMERNPYTIEVGVRMVRAKEQKR